VRQAEPSAALVARPEPLLEDSAPSLAPVSPLSFAGGGALLHAAW
jgi:hypothetical protein